MEINWEDYYYKKSQNIDAHDINKLMNIAETLHIEKFNVKPITIAGYKRYKHDVLNGIIDTVMFEDKPYNEYDLLTKEEQKAYDKGELVF